MKLSDEALLDMVLQTLDEAGLLMAPQARAIFRMWHERRRRGKFGYR